ncbi:transposase [Bacillus cereus]|nr:transposase [Bacillus cereus]
MFFGKHSELRNRALHDQLPRSSARNLLIHAISMWNTNELSIKKIKE